MPGQGEGHEDRADAERSPYGIALGPTSRCRPASYSRSNICHLDSIGAVAEYTIPAHPGAPQWFTRGHDDGVWFTEFAGSTSDVRRAGFP